MNKPIMNNNDQSISLTVLLIIQLIKQFVNNSSHSINHTIQPFNTINQSTNQSVSHSTFISFYREGGNPSWSLIRDAQLAAMQLPLVHVASAQDLGDEASPQGTIRQYKPDWSFDCLVICLFDRSSDCFFLVLDRCTIRSLSHHSPFL